MEVVATFPSGVCAAHAHTHTHKRSVFFWWGFTVTSLAIPAFLWLVDVWSGIVESWSHNSSPLPQQPKRMKLSPFDRFFPGRNWITMPTIQAMRDPPWNFVPLEVDRHGLSAWDKTAATIVPCPWRKPPYSWQPTIWRQPICTLDLGASVNSEPCEV